MTKLPEPNWITLSESARRAAQAFGAEQSAVETALVAAFHDGKIRTRGRCRSFFEHGVLRDLASYIWDKAGVDWQQSRFAIPDDRRGRELHYGSRWPGGRVLTRAFLLKTLFAVFHRALDLGRKRRNAGVPCGR
jgi:hypothetical protein